jgi:hypothetical protein
MKTKTAAALILSVVLLASGCATKISSSARESSSAGDLVGAWRAKVHFKTGAFAPFKDLEFMYVFNAGGTMTESSNYDGAPPVPPAYGVWKRTGPGEFEARYSFYSTKSPTNFDDIAKGGGWMPSGHGTLIERIRLSDDGKSFRSTMHFEAFDQAGKPAEGGGDAVTEGTRMGF